MRTGQGWLVLNNGRRLPLLYKFGAENGEACTGYLLCDTSKVDPAILCGGMHVLCEDGIDMIVGVIQSGGRFHSVTGQVAREDAA